MVHILMISAEYSPDPPTLTRVSVLATYFAVQGHEVILLSNSGRLAKGNALSVLLRNLVPLRAEVGGVNWFFPPVLRTGLRRGSLKVVEGLLATLSTLAFGAILLLSYGRATEVVYASTAQTQGFIGSFLTTALRKPLVVNYGDPAFVRDTGLVRAFERVFEIITLSKSDHVFADDPVKVEFVKREYGKSVMFLPSGYDPKLFRNAKDYEGNKSGKKIVVFVGKLDLSIYRLDVLLNALSLLRDKVGISVELRLIGEGPDMTRLKSLAADLGVRRSVQFLGAVPHADVPGWLSTSDICVQITNDMCAGIKVAEYMAAKRPVIIAAPWWNKYRRFLRNGVNCAMVPLDAERLANAMTHLLKHPRVAKRIAANGFKTIRPWTWDAIARKKIAIINKSVTGSSPRLSKSTTPNTL
jgi:glycosyltransferase involved in cell wall biosynthesis